MKDKKTLGLIIATAVLLVILVGASIAFAQSNGADLFAKHTPAPSPTVTPAPAPTLQPSPPPTPRPVIRGYTEYGLVRHVVYPDFIGMYNDCIEWYLNERSVTDIDLSLTDNTEAIKHGITDDWYTDNQDLPQGRTVSIAVVNYLPYVAGVEYASGTAAEDDMDIVHSLICAVDWDAFEDVTGQLDVENTFKKERSRTAVTNGIAYILEIDGDGTRFTVNLYESDTTPTPVEPPPPSLEMQYSQFIIDQNEIMGRNFARLDELNKAGLENNNLLYDATWINEYAACANRIQDACQQIINYPESKVPQSDKEIHAEDVLACQFYYDGLALEIRAHNLPLSQERIDLLNQANALADQGRIHQQNAIEMLKEQLRSQGVDIE